MSPTLSLPCCASAGLAASIAHAVAIAAMVAIVAPVRRGNLISFMTRSSQMICCRSRARPLKRRRRDSCCPCPQLETLDLTCCGLGQLVDELDPARIFIRGQLRLHMLAELFCQHVGAAVGALEHDIR